MKSYLSVLLLFSTLLPVQACVSTGSWEIAAAVVTAKIETDKSTRAEVSALLGLPAIVAYGEKGQETWNYYYVTEYPTPTDFLPLVDAFVPGFKQNTKVLTVTFDRQGVARQLQQSRVAGKPEVYPY